MTDVFKPWLCAEQGPGSLTDINECHFSFRHMTVKRGLCFLVILLGQSFHFTFVHPGMGAHQPWRASWSG